MMWVVKRKVRGDYWSVRTESWHHDLRFASTFDNLKSAETAANKLGGAAPARLDFEQKRAEMRGGK